MMRWLHALRARLTLLFRGSDAEARMAEEMAFHVDMETDRLIRQSGLSPAEARRQALVAFGGVEKHKEQMRDGQGWGVLSGLSLDLRLGIRMLRKSPGLTLVATLALSVAIGGGTAYFEFLHDLYRPQIVSADGRVLVGIQNRDILRDAIDPRALHDFELWRQQLASVDGLGAFRQLDRNLIISDGHAEPVKGAEISASAFALMGARPVLGRLLTPQDEAAGAPPVVLLGYELWLRRFGADSSVVGQTIRLGNDMHTIVGVMQPGFSFPVNHALWTPFRWHAINMVRGAGPAIQVYGALAPGVSIEMAQREVMALSRRTALDFPGSSQQLVGQVQPYVTSLRADAVDDALQRQILYAANILFLGLLGVCGANVATLVFARVATRGGELTVRYALGANRSRIVGQLLAEALVLSLLAMAIGLLAADQLSRWILGVVTSAGGAPPFWWNPALSPGSIAYAVTLTLLTTLLVGLLPALKATGPDLQDGLKRSFAGGSRMKFGGVWTGVIVTQVALTVLFLMVVTSVGWNVRVGRFGSAVLQFPTRQYLSVRLEPGFTLEAGASDTAARKHWAQSLTTLSHAIHDEPGVIGAALATSLPDGDHPPMAIEIEGTTVIRGDEAWVRTAAVDPSFFQAFGAQLLSGREITAADVLNDAPVAVIDQNLAAKYFGGRSPIGQRVRRAAVEEGETAGPWVEVIGVVQALTVERGSSSEPLMLYRPLRIDSPGPVHLAVKLADEPRLFIPRLRAIASQVDPSLRLYNVIRMDEAGQWNRLVLGYLGRLLALLGGIALLLATTGIYSLMAFTVSRRTREIGIRVAVGADRRRVVTGIFARAAMQISAGILLGSVPGAMLVAWGAPEIAEGGGIGVGLVAFTCIACFMLLTGLAASFIPARRALRIQPTEALRAD